MNKQRSIIIGIIFAILALIAGFILFIDSVVSQKFIDVKSATVPDSYWFVLHRKSNTEELLKGTPGDKSKSSLVKKFNVKTGIPGERPTPLPGLLGREYWVLTDEFETPDNLETSPYFLTLDVPVTDFEPYGPVGYEECDGPASPNRGEQCNWITPGAFGLHGVASDSSRLSVDNPGSSGCIRHSDEDITYLFNLLDPKSQQIRYYVEDN